MQTKLSIEHVLNNDCHAFSRRNEVELYFRSLLLRYIGVKFTVGTYQYLLRVTGIFLISGSFKLGFQATHIAVI